MNEKNIKTLINELKLEIQGAILNFQSGRDNAATLKVTTITQKLLNILSGIKSSNLVEVLEIDYNTLNTILLNVSKSIETENYVLIDDLFEYELMLMLDTWILKIDTLISSEEAYDRK